MDINEKWQFVESSLLTLKISQQNIFQLSEFTGISDESEVFKPFYTLCDLMIEAISILIDDNQEYILWFVFENDFGKSEKKAGNKGDLREIKTVANLRWLIETVNKG